VVEVVEVVEVSGVSEALVCMLVQQVFLSFGKLEKFVLTLNFAVCLRILLPSDNETVVGLLVAVEDSTETLVYPDMH
jgi:hypothetical protein